MEEFILCLTTPMDLDEFLFHAWTQGFTKDQAISNRSKDSFGSFAFQFRHQNEKVKIPESFIRKEIYDQYRTFELLEHYLQYPTLLGEQQLVEIELHTQTSFIEKYWSLDSSFVKEMLISKKLKSRKDLDDISETVALNLRRVTRQYENVKRVEKAMEDKVHPWQCNLHGFVCDNFRLSHVLSRRYACILFLLFAKFSLTSKKRMQRVSCEGLESCAALIMVCLNTSDRTFYSIQNRLGDGGGRDSPRLHNKTGEADVDATSVPDYWMIGDDVEGWNRVWYLFERVESAELDKQLLLSLQYIRNSLTGIDLEEAVKKVLRAHVELGEGERRRQLAVAASPPTTPSAAASSSSSASFSFPAPFGVFTSSYVNATAVAASSGGSGGLVTPGSSQSIAVSQGPTSVSVSTAGASGAVTGGSASSVPMSPSSPSLSGQSQRIGLSSSNSSSSSSVSGGSGRVRSLDPQRIKPVVKALILIGANLSQSREYRDLLEDLLTKVAEPLEEMGLREAEIQTFMLACLTAVKAVPSVAAVMAGSIPGYTGSGRNNASMSSISTSTSTSTSPSFNGPASSTSTATFLSQVHSAPINLESAVYSTGGGSMTATQAGAVPATSAGSAISKSIIEPAGSSSGTGLSVVATSPSSSSGTGGSTKSSSPNPPPLSSLGGDITSNSGSSSTRGDGQLGRAKSTSGLLTPSVSIAGHESSAMNGSSSDSSRGGLAGVGAGGGSSIELSRAASASTGTTSSTSAPSSKAAAQAEILRRDWIRFVTCCRLCLKELIRDQKA